MTLCRLNRIYHPVHTLGYGQRLGVWVQGCSRRCSECMSPEMQPFAGPQIAIEDVLSRLPTDLQADGLTISGGEPFDQPEAVAALVRWFQQHYCDDILIYTGYLYEDLLLRQDNSTVWLLKNISALVDGPYLSKEDNGVGMKGSQNQRLFLFRHHDRYKDFSTAKRTMQCIDEGDNLFFIGVLPKEKQKE